MLGSLANGRLAHDQSALGVTVGGREQCPEGRSWLSTADFGQHESAEAAGKKMLVTCLQFHPRVQDIVQNCIYISLTTIEILAEEEQPPNFSVNVHCGCCIPRYTSHSTF